MLSAQLTFSNSFQTLRYIGFVSKKIPIWNCQWHPGLVMGLDNSITHKHCGPGLTHKSKYIFVIKLFLAKWYAWIPCWFIYDSLSLVNLLLIVSGKKITVF